MLYFGSAGCVEPGVVTPFEENTGDGDDESDVDHTHGPGKQFIRRFLQQLNDPSLM
jgi:hypothetical protein